MIRINLTVSADMLTAVGTGRRECCAATNPKPVWIVDFCTQGLKVIHDVGKDCSISPPISR